MFDALAGYLAASFTVIAYDQRDCGQTENPAVPYLLADLGDDAAALIEALRLERAHIYGSSLGGLVAQSLAARHPDRVDRLVLGNTWRAGLSPAEFNPEGLKQLAAYRVDLAANASKLPSSSSRLPSSKPSRPSSTCSAAVAAARTSAPDAAR